MATQETQTDLEKVFQGIKLEDVSVQPDGRIEIKNPEIAAQVGRLALAAAALAGNTECSNTRCGTTGSNTRCSNNGCA
jgi:hypothetical protein